MKAQRSQIRILVVTTTRMEVMKNSTRREVIKIGEGRGNLIKGIYSAMHGHFANECYSNKEKQKKEDEAQMAQSDSDDFDSDHVLLMYLVTRYSNHMTGDKRWFVNLDEKVKRMVKFVDNSIVTAKGMGKVLIHGRDGQ
ncbi:hypothetical protein CR513_23713, partial [Mucuna pruriens]